MPGRTMGEEQDARRHLVLLERIAVALEKIAVSLESSELAVFGSGCEECEGLGSITLENGHGVSATTPCPYCTPKVPPVEASGVRK